MMAENDHQTPAALVLQTDAAAVLERDPELREKLLRRLLAALNSEVRQAYNKRVGRFVTRSFLTYALLQMDLLGLFCIAEACAPAACHVTSSVAGALGCQSCCPTCPCSSCLPSLAQIATALKAPGLAGASGSGLSPSGYSLLCLYCGEIGCFHYKLGTLPVNHFHPPSSWQPYAGGVENFCAPLRCWSLAREMRATTLRVEDLEDFFMSEYEQDEAKGVQPGREQGQGRRGVNTGRGTRAPHRAEQQQHG
eukprot:g12189.t1